MCLRSTWERCAAVVGLQRMATCSSRYLSAISATVGPGAGLGAAGAGTGSSPAFTRVMTSAARCRACSAVITPWRPTVTRFDTPFTRVWAM